MDQSDSPDKPAKPAQPTFRPTSRKAPPVLEELAIPSSGGVPPEGEPPPEREPPPEPEIEWLVPFENRFIIAGVSLLGVLALTAIVLLVFSRGDGGATFTPNLGVLSNDDDDKTPTVDFALTAEALTTTTLRNGPSESFVPLGTVPRGARVPIVGRNEDDTWLQVTYPPGSPLRGWVNIEFFEVTGELHDVDIAGPGSGPSIVVPTSIPTLVSEDPTDTPVPTDEPTDTPEFKETPIVTETGEPALTREPTETEGPPDPTETSEVKPEPSPTEPEPSPETQASP